jgi:hypothetical protein
VVTGQNVICYTVRLVMQHIKVKAPKCDSLKPASAHGHAQVNHTCPTDLHMAAGYRRYRSSCWAPAQYTPSAFLFQIIPNLILGCHCSGRADAKSLSIS